MSQRYQAACRKEKRIILDELVKNLGLHRKSAIRALAEVKIRKPKESRGCRRIYNDFVVLHLRKLWIRDGSIMFKEDEKSTSALDQKLRLPRGDQSVFVSNE